MAKLTLDRLILHTAMMLNRGVSSPEPVVRDSRDSGLLPRWLEHIFGPIRRDETRAIAGREDERLRIVAVCVAVLAPAFDVRGQLRRHSDLPVSLECRVPLLDLVRSGIK